MNSSEDWSATLRESLTGGRGPVHLVGVGNELRGDDGVGLVISSELRSKLGANPAPGVKVHGVTRSPERLLSKLAAGGARIVVFDSVEASREPGGVVCARLSNTRFGFFATHNVPLRLIPGVSGHEEDIYLVGVQPQAMEVGEGLTEVVGASVERIVEVVADALEERP